MPNTYEKLYAWILASFADGPFTSVDFDMTFPSPAPAKVLSDLRRLGMIEAIRRGTYRAVPPDGRFSRMVQREDSFRFIAEQASLPFAYSQSTAITIWTDGGYWTGFTRGFKPVHIDVRKADVPSWQRFFRSAGARSTVEGARETLFGVVHVLHPMKSIRSVRRGGVHVVPKEVAYEYAKARPYAYEPVIPILRRGDRSSARRGRTPSREKHGVPA